MGEAQTSNGSGKAAGGLGALVEAMRPPHWVKNAFVAAPLLFSGRFTDATAWVLCLVAVAAFCCASSGAYIVNDWTDREADRLHPAKRDRPIASGRVGRRSAQAGAAALLAFSLAIVALLEALAPAGRTLLGGHALLAWTAAYVALNLLYSFWLKNVVIVDVLVVAMGFVLRAMAGAAAIVVPVSPWLVVCTLTLCLFIAVTKRRGEIAAVGPAGAGASRPVNARYDAQLLEFMLTVSTAMAILTYALYCLAPGTVRRIGSAHMVWTVPLVVYAMFRHHRITRSAAGADPVALLLRDRIMWIVLATYAVLCGLVIKFGAHPAVRDILDFHV